MADKIVKGMHGCSRADTYVVPAEPEVREKLEWFQDQKLAIMFHFGIYSQPGIRESWPLSDGDADWSRSGVDWEPDGEIFKEQYRNLNKSFNPIRFEPEKWASFAAENGFRYVIFTTKHHDGFCLFDSKFTDYKVTKTPFGRDIVREFVDAFRAEGIRIGFYYSVIDWHHPDFTVDYCHPLRAPDNFKGKEEEEFFAKANEGKDMGRYRKYMKDQIRELLTNYGRIDIMWYDFSYPNSFMPKGHDDWDSKGIVELTRELQPWAIIDNRLDLLDTTWGWDFITPEQFKVTEWPKWKGREMPWETCQTFSGHWGYARDEMTWKTPHQLIELLVHTVSFGGNLIMNVGPTARGEFDDRATDALAAYGRWMQANGRAIYGCTRAPAEFKAPESTLLTYNPALNRLYVHLLSYPMGRLTVPFGDKVAFAQFLHDGSEIAVRKFSGGHGQNGDYAETHAFVLPIVKPRVEIPVIECRLKK